MALVLFKWFSVITVFFPIVFERNEAKLVHPFYVSVTEMNHNASEKTLEISCKIFTDDFEEAISKASAVRVDLASPKDKLAAEKLVASYLEKHLQIKLDGKLAKLEYVGYEREDEAVWSYLQVTNFSAPKKVEITNSLLYESFPQQINLLHVTINGDRKSTKLNNPSANVKFEF